MCRLYVMPGERTMKSMMLPSHLTEMALRMMYNLDLPATVSVRRSGIYVTVTKEDMPTMISDVSSIGCSSLRSLCLALLGESVSQSCC